MVCGRIASWQARYAVVVLAVVLSLRGLGRVTIVGRLQIWHRQTDFLNETTVSLSGNDLELNEHSLRGLDIDGALIRIDKGAGQDLVHDSDAVNLISQNVCQDVIVGGRK